MKETYFVPSHNLESLKKRIDKVNKKAKKLGVEPVTIKATGNVEERKTGSRKNVFGERVDIMTMFIEIQIEGIEPTIKGFSLIAAIDHRDGFPAILTIDGDCPNDQRERGPVCDHCKHNRQRNQTYVLRDESGEYITVGSTCLKDFIGDWHTDPHKMAEFFCAIHSLINEDFTNTHWDEGMSRVTPVVSVVEAVAITGAILEFEPFISRSKEEVPGTATATQVGCYITSPRITQEFRDWCDKVTRNINQDIRTEAEKAVEWALSHEGSDNDFLYTIANLAKAETVRTERLGHVAAILPCYRREQEKKQEAANRPESNHVGTLNAREVFNVTLESTRIIEGYYGDKNLHRFRDESGNLIIWFKSGSNSDFKEGEFYTVNATVKKHDEFRGQKQTVVNRVTKVKGKYPLTRSQIDAIIR